MMRYTLIQYVRLIAAIVFVSVLFWVPGHSFHWWGQVLSWIAIATMTTFTLKWLYVEEN